MYNIVKDSVVSLSCDGLEDLQSSFDTVTDTQVDQPVKPAREAFRGDSIAHVSKTITHYILEVMLPLTCPV